MNEQSRRVSLGHAVLCVLLCVIFASLTTYQFCYYSIFSAHKQELGEVTAAMKAEHDLLIAARDAQIAELSARLATAEAERAALTEQVNTLSARLIDLTGSTEGTAADCLRLLVTEALIRQSLAADASRPAHVEEEVAAYMANYASSFVATAERLLLVDFIYRTNYAGTPPTAIAAEEAMLEGYIQAAGDVYATYYTPEEYLAFTDQMNANIRCGIGVISAESAEKDAILVLHVHSTSPAGEAGLQPGDRITAIDGQSVAAIGYDAAIALVAGKPNTAVALTVQRGEETLSFAVIRRAVTADVLITRTYEGLGKKIGYVRLLSFNNRTAEQLEGALAKLQTAGVDALVFDLRDNTGGSLSSILDVLDLLLPAGKQIISYEFGNEHNAREPYYTKTEAAVTLPIVVLQNRRTASAAELFCATLRDHDYATLVGETTYGKGTMQTGYLLENGSYMTVTVAGYLPPSGVSYHGIGIAPHYRVMLDEDLVDHSIYTLPLAQDKPLLAALQLLTGPND
jgi:carboxyl-terminal processing protease